MASALSTKQIAARFEREASFWRDVYDADTVFARVHRRRQALALSWIDRLGLVCGAQVLEVGCGAGLMAAALAERGFRVVGMDPAHAMLVAARRQVGESGVAERVRLASGDAQAAMFPDESFDLVVGLGVLPWLGHPEQALREIARVTKSAGYLIVNVDNSMGLTNLFDPLRTPFLRSFRAAVGSRRGGLDPSRRDRRPVRAATHGIGQFDALLAAAHVEKMAAGTFGFGPFTFLGRTVIPRQAGRVLDDRLQRWADTGMPLLSSAGSQYLVLARRMAR